MAREARRIAESGLYHIVLRSNNKLLFVEASDYRKFIELLDSIAARDLMEVCAYCLFSEAVHLVVKEGLAEISSSMKHLISSYALWCNLKYERSGKLFFDRFASEPIESDSELMDVCRYVFRLPASRGYDINYEYSSYNNYLKKQGLRSDALMLLHNQSTMAYKAYNEQSVSGEFLSDLPKVKLTDAELAAKIKQLLLDATQEELDMLTDYEFKILVRRFKKIEGASIRQLSRVLNISKSFIERA